ncbi:hypothetical protein D018_1752A, partial [Vibrio parahaemolyticus VP2007-007]
MTSIKHNPFLGPTLKKRTYSNNLSDA